MNASIHKVNLSPKTKLLSPSGVFASVSLIAVALVGGGCQTFSLTEAEFEAQQRGGAADPQTAAAVDVVGSLGALAGTAAAGIAEALK